MTISVSCDCGKTYEVPEARAGQSAICGACGQTVTVGGAPGELSWLPPPEQAGVAPSLAAVLTLLGGLMLAIALVVNNEAAAEEQAAPTVRAARQPQRDRSAVFTLAMLGSGLLGSAATCWTFAAVRRDQGVRA